MRYWIITILSFLSCLAEAQKIDIALAEKLLEKEYVFFVSASDSAKAAIIFDKADLYTSKGDYESALLELDRAEKIPAVDQVVLKYERMLNFFLANRFDISSSLILSPEELIKMKRDKEYYVMRLFSLNETGKWAICKEELLKYCVGCDSSLLRAVSELPVFHDYVSPLKCRTLSAIIPGLGMTKAGKPLKGATSFFLQSGLAVFAGFSFYSGYYVAGVVSGVFPLLKFHKGGVRLSGILADERNEKEKMKLQLLYREQIKKVVYR